MNQPVSETKSKKVRNDFIMGCVMLAMFTAFLVASFDFGVRARMVPIPVAISGIVLIIVDQIFSKIIKRKINMDSEELFAKNVIVGSCNQDKLDRSNKGTEKIALLLVAGLTLLVCLFGILGGIFLFVTLFFRYRNKAGLAAALAWGLGVTGSIYLVFGIFLQVVFYHGVIFTPIISKFSG